MHKVIESDSYFQTAILKTTNGYLKARLEKKFNSVAELTEIRTKTNEKPKHWLHERVALFADGSNHTIFPFRWGQTQEEVLTIDHRDERYLWVDLANAGLTKGYDGEVLKKVIEARLALDEAQEVYEETMVALGAEYNEKEIHVVSNEWWELPGAPLKF